MLAFLRLKLKNKFNNDLKAKVNQIALRMKKAKLKLKATKRDVKVKNLKVHTYEPSKLKR